MLLIYLTLIFVIFISVSFEAIATIIFNARHKMSIPARCWWIPSIIGGIWFYILMLYLK